MPVTVVVGGQYGSEGKGKVANYLATSGRFDASIRVGGPNSGHTVEDTHGRRTILRQLPVAALADRTLLVLPAGSYLDPEVLRKEIETHHITPDRLAIDPSAVIITPEDRAAEANLRAEIGSTGSGIGNAVLRRVSRDGTTVFAGGHDLFGAYVRPTTPLLRSLLDRGRRILIEGTQGFGLSPLHGGFGRYATSRDTTAAGFVSEAGLSPLDVDAVVQVVRSFPIRVAGNSGPLPFETEWAEVAASAGVPNLLERTTVTHRVRRVARFEPSVVRRAIEANQPTCLVLNHADYLGDLATVTGVAQAKASVASIEHTLEREFDLVGTSPATLLTRAEWGRLEPQEQPHSASA